MLHELAVLQEIHGTAFPTRDGGASRQTQGMTETFAAGVHLKASFSFEKR